MWIGVLKGTPVPGRHAKGLDLNEFQTIAAVFQIQRSNRFGIPLLIHVNADVELIKDKSAELSRLCQYFAMEPLYLMLQKKNQKLLQPLKAALLAMTKEGLIEKINRDTMLSYNIQPLKPM